MTINAIIRLLKENGCNSKQQVIDLLEKASIKDLQELQRDCSLQISLKKIEKAKESNRVSI